MEESRQRIAKASRDPRANGDRDGGQVGFRNRKTPCGGRAGHQKTNFSLRLCSY